MAIECQKTWQPLSFDPLIYSTFPYLSCWVQERFNTFAIETIWGSKRKETDKWPIIQTHWKTQPAFALYWNADRTQDKAIPSHQTFVLEECSLHVELIHSCRYATLFSCCLAQSFVTTLAIHRFHSAKIWGTASQRWLK